MRISQSILFCMFFFCLLSPARAEYYLVRTKLDNGRHAHWHYKDEQIVKHHAPQRHSSPISQKTSNYNLDLITGDDDPYVYPGMNIDN